MLVHDISFSFKFFLHPLEEFPFLMYLFGVHLNPPIVQLEIFIWIVPSGLCMRRWNVLQAVRALHGGHSIINMASWVGAVHWMRRWLILYLGIVFLLYMLVSFFFFFGILSLVLGGSNKTFQGTSLFGLLGWSASTVSTFGLLLPYWIRTIGRMRLPFPQVRPTWR